MLILHIILLSLQINIDISYLDVQVSLSLLLKYSLKPQKKKKKLINLITKTKYPDESCQRNKCLSDLFFLEKTTSSWTKADEECVSNSEVYMKKISF